jgi:hypothetical protein
MIRRESKITNRKDNLINFRIKRSLFVKNLDFTTLISPKAMILHAVFHRNYRV